MVGSPELYGLSAADYAEAEEKGRRMTALMLLDNRERLAEIELIAGREYCMKRYPECYNKSFMESGT